jgi:hypothetical protein
MTVQKDKRILKRKERIIETGPTMPMIKVIVQVGMKPGFCKFKLTAGTGNTRNRPIWQSGQPTQSGNVLPNG